MLRKVWKAIKRRCSFWWQCRKLRRLEPHVRELVSLALLNAWEWHQVAPCLFVLAPPEGHRCHGWTGNWLPYERRTFREYRVPHFLLYEGVQDDLYATVPQ